MTIMSPLSKMLIVSLLAIIAFLIYEMIVKGIDRYRQIKFNFVDCPYKMPRKRPR